MPLHGRKVVNLVKALMNVDPQETIYTVPHTQEQFRSKAEYERRMAQYVKPVWTCQCTGHINMTHEEAYRSEQEKLTILHDQFPKYFEKTVLELVHHNTEILDNLVDQAWTRIQQAFAVGETVSLKAKAHGKVIKGEVVKVDITEAGSPQKNELPNGNCNSPSSDKENAASNNAESDHTPTKWVHPKLLNYKYNLKLEGEDRTIAGIPAHDLQRVNRPPSKDLVKLFIRSHALRHGTHNNSPWAVNDSHVKNYVLKSKYADFLVSPQKMTGINKKSGETKRKRSSTSKDIAPGAKRKKQTQLTLKSPDAAPKKRGRPPKSANSTPLASPKKPETPKKSPQKTPVKATPKVTVVKSSSSNDVSNSDDNVVLAVLKVGKKPVLSSPKKSATPRKRSLADLKRQMEENTPLSQLKSPVVKLLNADGSPKKKRGRPPKPKAPNAVTTPKKRGRPKKDSTAPSSPKKSPAKAATSTSATNAKRGRPKKNMKQMTLFDLKGKGKGVKSPTKGTPKSPRKPQTPVKLPPIVARLRKAFKVKNTNNKDRYQYYRLLTTVAEKLTKRQQAILPDDIKGVLLMKIAVLDEKKKLKKMTPEQREEYIKQKRKERAKERAKVEDTYLSDLQQLPRPKLVPSPDGIANELFGDIVMITEFINCYKGLILPEDKRIFNANEAMKSISGGEGSFLYIGQMLQVLLQTLLQDGIAQDYKELGMALANITVTPYGTAELARLCLRDNDDEDESPDDEDSDEDEDRGQHDEVPSELVEQLECTELWSFSPTEKLAVLKGLCHRMMNSYSVQDYMLQCQQTVTDLWRKRVAGGYSKAKNLRLLVKKEEEEEAKPEQESKPGVTLNDFYGKAPLANAAPTSDLASIVKRRRVLAVRAVEEKRMRDEVERKRRQKEYDEERKLREFENFEKDFLDGITVAKLVLRQTPIGTDRDHNRYWQFLGATPGLYVEKGWAPPEMEYHVGPKKDSWDTSDSDSESDSETERRGRKPRESDLRREKTVPHVGQNLWFYYDNLADIQSLMDRLHPRGVRENNLGMGLKKIYPLIEAEFKRVAKCKDKPQDDPEIDKIASNLIEGMRQDLLDVEMRLRNGGLGGVDNFTDWQASINKATTLQEFGVLLIETQTYVPGKFLTGFLGPEGMYNKKKSKEENATNGEDNGNEAQEDVHAGMERWKEAINSCLTFSRLHVLLAMLDSCVKWERSMENAKCKVCRRKGDEFLLCDDCNQPFHLYCLRPALPCVPSGEWLCPACLPSSHRKNSRNKDYRRMAEGSSESEDSESAGSGEDEVESNEEVVREVDAECTVCGGDEGLISCSSCPSSFHIDCHNPPLRRMPRSIWKCQQCVTGVRIRKAKRVRSQRTKRSARNTKTYTYDNSSSEESEESDDNDDDEDDDEEEESDDSNTEPAQKTTTRGRGQSKKAAEESEEEEEESDDVEAEDEEEDEEEESDSDSESIKAEAAAKEASEKMLHAIKTTVTRIIRHRCAWPFIDPVDRNEVPDYYDIVTTPICLQDLKVKVDDNDYEEPQELMDDVALLFSNADLYNKRNSLVGKCIEPLEKAFLGLKKKYFPDYEYQRLEAPKQEKRVEHYSSDTESSS